MIGENSSFKNSANFSSFSEILKESWNFFKENFPSLFLIVLIIESPFILFKEQIYSYFLRNFQNVMSFSFLVILLFIFIFALKSIVVFEFIKKKRENKNVLIKDCFKEAFAKLFSFLWVSLLTVLAVIGGLILFIVPGLIFYIWLLFSSLLVVFEDLKGFKALERSRYLSSGYFWKIVENLILIFLLLMLPLIIIENLNNVFPNFFQPFLRLITSLISIFGLIFLVFLYLEIKRVKEGIS